MRFSPRHLWFTLGSAALATLALLIGPIGEQTGPIVPPYVPIDLRLVALPFLFTLLYLLSLRARWPYGATAVVGPAVATAIMAHLHASAVLDYVGVDWAEPGARVNVIAVLASAGSILLAVWIALEAGRDRFVERSRALGIEAEQVDRAASQADALAQSALVTAGVALAVLALALRIMDQVSGGERIPIPEVVAVAIVLAVGVALTGLAGDAPSWLPMGSGRGPDRPR